MPPEKPRAGGQPAWKGAAAAGKPAARGPQFAWKPQEQAAVETARWYRRAKLGGFLLGGLTCAALIGFLIWYLWPTKGATLVLVGADPAVDVEKLDAPLDAFGWRAGIRLAGWSAAATGDQARRNKLTPKLADEGQLTPEMLRPADLPAFFQKLERRELNPLILYFGLHGAADATGPFLFTSGGERLYVRELIEGFASPRLRDKQVVLLFDSSRLDPDPTLGVLHADFVRGLKALDDEGIFDQVPNLVAITASDAGERGWSAEEWGTTGFAEAVLRGLSGAAKPSRGALVTAAGLFDYVHDQTASWSQSARPTPQTPVLLPKTDGQARAERVVVTTNVGEATDWPAAAPPPLPESLVKHWADARDLEDGTPSPAVYTPKLWRRYRELLLRYSQLLRAGEDAAARRLGDILDRTEQDLRDGRGLRLAGGEAPKSRGNAVPLPVALGLTGGRPASDTAFNRVWQAADAEWDKRWEDLVKGNVTPDLLRTDLLRTGFYDFVLRQVIGRAAKRGDFDKAAAMMGRPWLGGAGIRPAEAHLLVMSQKFFDKVKAGEPPLDVWQRALEVRRLAERAALSVNPPPPGGGAPPHPYSEALWTHLGPAVEAADSRRRDGEDRLFGSLEAVHNRAREDLDAAAKQYEDVLRQAQALQAAYATRDEALAQLPLLTRWVASLPATKSDVGTQPEVVRNVWPKVHTLARRLDGTDRPTGPDRLTEEIRTDLERLKQDYRDRCQQLADKDLQGQWEAIEQVMAVPPMLIPADLRKDLVESGRRQVAKLSNEWVQPDRKAVAPPPTTAEDAKTARAARVVQQARLAVAVLGDIPNDQRSDRKGELLNAEGLRIKLAEVTRENWQAPVTVIGDHVGRHWQAMAAPAGKDTTDATAEFRSRWTVAFRPIDGPEPATTGRLKRWQKLLVGLAFRTARDHWYEADQRPVEYFRAAAKLYLDDAKSAGDGSAAVPDVGPVNDLLTADRLELDRVDFRQRVNLTSDNHRNLTFAVRAPKNTPVGYVTLWPQFGQSAAMSLSGDDLPRQPALLPDAKRDVHVTVKPTATDDTATLTAAGYFRGQWLKTDTEIQLTRTPEVILTRVTPPNDAAVAVRASDDLDLGAISIVVDFSGSMTARPNGPADWTKPDSKNQKAVATLREVLLGLPPGTPISLRLFGHKYDAELYKRLHDALPNKNDNGAKEVIGTQATESELIYKGKVTWSRANPAPLQNDILSKLEVVPQYYTPLARMMVKAKDDFPEGYKGTKTLLVLTDGADTSFPEANGVRIAEVKKQLKDGFEGANISIQMVLFRVDAKELKTALAQFKEEVEERFQPPGRIWVAADNSKLTDMIDLALRPKLRLLDLGGEAAGGVTRGGLPANRPADRLINLRWTGAIDPKIYEGRVLQSKQLFNLQRGDRMLVRLFKDSTGVRFERNLLADELPKARVARGDDWVLGLPYYHAAVTGRDNPLALTATLETPRGKSPGRDGNLQQTRPGFVWWEVSPRSGAKPTTVRVGERPQLPAPAWDIMASGWPGTATSYRPAAVKAWADFAAPPAAYRVKIDPARLAAGVVQLEADGEDGKVQVFASLEDWPLKADFESGAPAPRSCLVVRLQHPDKKPVFVRPAGFDFPAYEQRFYPPSAAVTAVFGPVTRDLLDARLQGRPLELELVAVERFKAAVKPVELEMAPAGTEQPLIDPPNLGDDAGKAK